MVWEIAGVARYMKNNGDDMDGASFPYEEGVVISANDALAVEAYVKSLRQKSSPSPVKDEQG